MDEATGLANDVGLLADQMDSTPPCHMLGNLQQGLSHLTVINAATSFAGIERRSADTAAAGKRQRTVSAVSSRHER